jgi:hypothetical protein
MRWTQKLWRVRRTQRHSPTLVDDERANGTIVGTTDNVVPEDIKRKQISLAIRYVALARGR